MVGARIKMENKNLLEKTIQFLIPLELHPETNKNIYQSEVKETDQNKDEIKYEDDMIAN